MPRTVKLLIGLRQPVKLQGVVAQNAALVGWADIGDVEETLYRPAA